MLLGINLSLSAHSLVLLLGSALHLCIVDLLLVNSTLFRIRASLNRRSGGSLYLFCQPCGVSCPGPSI